MSARDKKIIIVLIGAVILALSYFLVFQQAQEKKAQLESENTTLRQKYQELSALAAKADDYKVEISTMNEEMEKLLKHYPSYLMIENTIMDVVSLEEETKTSVSSLSVAAPVAIDVNTGDVADSSTTNNTDVENTETTDTTDMDTTDTDTTAPVQTQISYQLYGVDNTVVFKANNTGLKKLIELVAKTDNRQKVSSLTVAFDESEGKLNGTLVYDAYFLYGIDKPYEAPYIPSMPHGTDDVFGTVGN